MFTIMGIIILSIVVVELSVEILMTDIASIPKDCLCGICFEEKKDSKESEEE